MGYTRRKNNFKKQGEEAKIKSWGYNKSSTISLGLHTIPKSALYTIIFSAFSLCMLSYRSGLKAFLISPYVIFSISWGFTLPLMFARWFLTQVRYKPKLDPWSLILCIRKAFSWRPPLICIGEEVTLAPLKQNKRNWRSWQSKSTACRRCQFQFLTSRAKRFSGGRCWERTHPETLETFLPVKVDAIDLDGLTQCNVGSYKA